MWRLKTLDSTARSYHNFISQWHRDILVIYHLSSIRRPLLSGKWMKSGWMDRWMEKTKKKQKKNKFSCFSLFIFPILCYISYLHSCFLLKIYFFFISSDDRNLNIKWGGGNIIQAAASFLLLSQDVGNEWSKKKSRRHFFFFSSFIQWNFGIDVQYKRNNDVIQVQVYLIILLMYKEILYL